jgi:hypothetical protein
MQRLTLIAKAVVKFKKRFAIYIRYRLLKPDLLYLCAVELWFVT